MPAAALIRSIGFGVVLLGRAPEARAQPQPADTGLRRLLHEYIALYRRDSLERWRTLFLPGFTVGFTNPDGSITERSLEGFLERQRAAFARNREMSEVLEHIEIQQRGSLASVWADFVFTADGRSRRGRLVMLCLRERTLWRIQSLLFSYLDGG